MKAFAWIQKNFSKIVSRYGGQYIVVAGGQVFSGKNPRVLDSEARRKFPKEEVLGMPVPEPQDFASVL